MGVENVRNKVLVLTLFIAVTVAFAGCGKKESVNANQVTNTQLTQSTKQSVTNNDELSKGPSTENEVKPVGPSFVPNFENINALMSLSKEEVLDRLGKDYEILKAGAEHLDNAYNYKNYGMTLIFDESSKTNRINLIECNEKVDINGTKLGMNFKQIQNMLGEGEIRELEALEPFQPNYSLLYEMEDCIIWFGADSKDSATSEFEIRNNRPLE